MRPAFMFATGIENSCPTIDHGKTRVDELALCHHYDRWREDFDCVQDLGLSFLRYGPPINCSWLGDGRYDWSFADQTFNDLRRRDLIPIADMCHFGVPDWIGNFQNPDFPKLFARYCRDFSLRFPWVQLYTPVNEMFICALFSASYGWWNEQDTSDRAFVTALEHIVKANVLAMKSILDVRPDALFIQSESSEYFHPDNPKAIEPAETLNWRRFLSLDLNYSREVDSQMYEFLMDKGMTRDEYHFFLQHEMKPYCILGNDYYVTNEHRVWEDGRTGIRVNAVLPGAVDTPMLWDNPNVESGAEKVDPADVGKPEDIAAVIAYLASDDASFVQGASVRMDGGRLDRL